MVMNLGSDQKNEITEQAKMSLLNRVQGVLFRDSLRASQDDLASDQIASWMTEEFWTYPTERPWKSPTADKR